MAFSAVLTWLFVTLSSFGAHAAVGGGGPIAKHGSTSVAFAPAVGGGGPIAKHLAPAVGGGGPIAKK